MLCHVLVAYVMPGRYWSIVMSKIGPSISFYHIPQEERSGTCYLHFWNSVVIGINNHSCSSSIIIITSTIITVHSNIQSSLHHHQIWYISEMWCAIPRYVMLYLIALCMSCNIFLNVLCTFFQSFIYYNFHIFCFQFNETLFKETIKSAIIKSDIDVAVSKKVAPLNQVIAEDMLVHVAAQLNLASKER